MPTIYIDTETTGLDPQTDDVIEIAIIDDTGNVLLDTLCRPLKNNTWDDAQRIHGITPAMCAGRPSLPDLIPQIQQIISQHDEQEVTTCQHHTGCGGCCETEQEVSFNLCEDCLDAYFEEEEDRNKQRWIPTDQRLPSPQQDVIFIVSADAIGAQEVALDGRKLGGRYLGDGTFSVPGQAFKASHWMPMPSGPEIK